MLSAKLPTLQSSPTSLRKSGEHLLRKQTCIGRETKQHLFDCILPLAANMFAGRVPKSTPHNIIWEVEQTNNRVEAWIESPQGASACTSVERMLQGLGAPTTKRKVVTRSTRMVAELVYELCSTIPKFCASSKIPLITVNQVVNAPSNAHASAEANMATPVYAPFGFDPGLKDETTGMNGTSELYPQRLCTALTCSILHKAITRRAKSDGRVEWMLTLRDEIFRAIYADYMADFPAQRVHSARLPKQSSPRSEPSTPSKQQFSSVSEANSFSSSLPPKRLPHLDASGLSGNSSARSDGSFVSFLRLTPYYERCNMLRTEVRRLVKQRQVYQAAEDNARLLNEKRQNVIMKTAKRWQTLLLKTVFRHWMLIAKHRIRQREKLRRYFRGVFAITKPKAFTLWKRWLNTTKLDRALKQTSHDKESLTIVESELAASLDTQRQLLAELRAAKKEVRDAQGRFIRLSDEIAAQRVDETVALNRQLVMTLINSGNNIMQALQKKLEKIMASPDLGKLAEIYYSTGERPIHRHREIDRRALKAEAELRKRLFKVERARTALMRKHQKGRKRKHKKALAKAKQITQLEVVTRYEENIRIQQASGSDVEPNERELAEIVQRAIFKVKREFQEKLEQKDNEVKERGHQLEIDQLKIRKRLMARIEAQWQYEQRQRTDRALTEPHIKAAIAALRSMDTRTKDKLNVFDRTGAPPLAVDELVLRWVQMQSYNTLFRAQPFKRRCLNFGEDLRDGKIFYAIMKRLLEASPAGEITRRKVDSSGKVVRGGIDRIKVEGNVIGGSCTVDAEDFLRAKLLLHHSEDLLTSKNMDTNDPYHLLTADEMEYEIDPAKMWQSMEKTAAKMRPPCAGFTSQEHVLSGEKGTLCSAAFLVRQMLTHPGVGIERVTFRKSDPKDLDDMLEMHEKLKAMSSSHDPGHLDDLKHVSDAEPPRPVTEVFIDPEHTEEEEAKTSEQEQTELNAKTKSAQILGRNMDYIIAKVKAVQRHHLAEVHTAARNADSEAAEATIASSNVAEEEPQKGVKKEAKDAKEGESKAEDEAEEQYLAMWDQGRLPLTDRQALLLQFFKLRREWRSEVDNLANYQTWDKWVKFYLALEDQKGGLRELLHTLIKTIDRLAAFDKTLAPFYARGKHATQVWSEIFHKLTKFLWRLMSSKASSEVQAPYAAMPLDGEAADDDKMYRTLIEMGAMPNPKKKKDPTSDESDSDKDEDESEAGFSTAAGESAEATTVTDMSDDDEYFEESEELGPVVAPEMPEHLRFKPAPRESVEDIYADYRLVDFRSRLMQFKFTRIRTRVVAELLQETEKEYSTHVMHGARDELSMLDKLRVMRVTLQKHYTKLEQVFSYYSKSQDSGDYCSMEEWKNFVRDSRLMRPSKKKPDSGEDFKEVTTVVRYASNPDVGEDMVTSMSRAKFLETVYEDSDWTRVKLEALDDPDELDQSHNSALSTSFDQFADDSAQNDSDTEPDAEDDFAETSDSDLGQTTTDEDADDSDDSFHDDGSDEEGTVKSLGRNPCEWVEMVIRSSLFLGNVRLKPHKRLEDFLTRVVFPSACTTNLDDIRGELALDSVQEVFAKHRKNLQKIFQHYAASTNNLGESTLALLQPSEPCINLNGWLQLMMDSKILTQPMDVPNNFPIQSASMVFQQVQMAEDTAGGNSVGGGTSEMIWIEFVEAVAVTACYLYRNPYIPLQVKLQDFLSHILIANQKKIALKKKRKR